MANPLYNRSRGVARNTFIEQEDAPETYTGKSGQVPMVIAGENALDFYQVLSGHAGLTVDVDHVTKTITFGLTTLNNAIGRQAGVGAASLSGNAPALVVA